MAPYWSFTPGPGEWHTLLVICQAVSGQGVPDVSLSSGTWLGCQLPPQALWCSLAQGEMNSSWESWLAQACSAGQRTGRCPRPIPVFLTSHAQRSAASSDGYPVCFPFEPGLSLFLWLLCACFLSFFPAPSLIHGTGSTPSTDVWKRRVDTEVTVGGFVSGQRG